MVKNTLENYKSAIKLKYDIEKTGTYSSFLENPSRARLRNLCAELFLNNKSPNDLKSFSAFFQFDFLPNCSNKLKQHTDKFRPIETFFKGETDLTDMDAVNIAAILVDFQPRPFLKFSKEETVKVGITATNVSESREEQPVIETINTIFGAINEVRKPHDQVPLKVKKDGFLKKSRLPVAVLLITLCCFGYILIPQKECMQWQNDHYQIVECEMEGIGLVDLYSIIPAKEELLTFKKIKVCDTTIFFKYDKPIVWYSKCKNKVDFFNGPGFNPENGKALKPITQYMIDKHIKSPSR